MVEQRKCTACGKPFPATAEYFHKNAGKPSGLHAICKTCKNARARHYTRVGSVKLYNNKPESEPVAMEVAKKSEFSFRTIIAGKVQFGHEWLFRDSR
jgi:hypothetical protein